MWACSSCLVETLNNMSKSYGLFESSIGWYRLSIRYDPPLTEDIKCSLGRGNYTWDPDVKCWFVRDHCIKGLGVVLRRHGYHLEGQSLKSENPWKEIFSSLPSDIARNLYLSSQKVIHPDITKGRTEDQCKRLIAAWEQFKEST